MSQIDSTSPAVAGDALGLELGHRRVSYGTDDAILYALAVGARAEDLELVFERDLRVLPTFVLPQCLWACDELGGRGFFSSADALQAGQRLELREPLAKAGTLEVDGRVGAVWDKGSAALYEVEVSGPGFTSVTSVFAPGRGGWGGERGPAALPDPEGEPSARRTVETSPEQAVLYRLTGDKHLIHVDPEAARAVGQPRPILHGLCTLSFAVRELAGMLGRPPWDVRALDARFAAPVLPGDLLEISAWEPLEDGTVPFAVATERGLALRGGRVRFE